jgi:hypothetical protein
MTEPKSAWPYLVNFLKVFRWIAIILIACSAVVYGLFGFMPILFCDTGPPSACFSDARKLWAIPFGQVAVFAIGWFLLWKRKWIILSGVLMVISILPLVWLAAQFRSQMGH